jgi:hypothetical protein
VSEQVLEPIIAGVSSRPPPPNARTWTPVEHDYHALCVDMEALFGDLGIATPRATSTKAA